MLGLAFCGSDRLQVASMVVPAEVNTMAEVASLLKSLKDTRVCHNVRQSIGFMFSCIGRGQYHYRGRRNVEASVFQRLFPNTPLFGFFGNGEIGFDYLPDYSQPEGDSNMCVVRETVEDEGEGQATVKTVPNLHHSYTTIFSILAIK